MYQKVEKTKVKWIELQNPTEYYTVTDTNGKIGLIDVKGHQIIPCLFQGTGQYHPKKSTVVVKYGGKESLYDIVKDSLTIACNYEKVFNYDSNVQYAIVNDETELWSQPVGFNC